MTRVAIALSLAILALALATSACPPTTTKTAPPADGGAPATADDAGLSLEARVALLELEVATLKLVPPSPPRTGPLESARLELMMFVEPLAATLGAKLSRPPPELLEKHRRNANDEAIVLRKGKRSLLIIASGVCKENDTRGSMLAGTKMASYSCSLRGDVLKPADREIVTPIDWSTNVLGISAENAIRSLQTTQNERQKPVLSAVVIDRIAAALR